MSFADLKKKAEFMQTWVTKSLDSDNLKNAKSYLEKLQGHVKELQALPTNGEVEAFLASCQQFVAASASAIEAKTIAAEIKAVLEKAEFKIKWCNTYLDQQKQSNAKSMFDEATKLVEKYLAEEAKISAMVPAFAAFVEKYHAASARLNGEQQNASAAASAKIIADVSTAFDKLKPQIAEYAANGSNNFDLRVNDLKRELAKLKPLTSDEQAVMLAGDIEKYIREQTDAFNRGKAAAKIKDITRETDRLKTQIAEYAASGSNNFDVRVNDLKREIKKLSDLMTDEAMAIANDLEQFLAEKVAQFNKSKYLSKVKDIETQSKRVKDNLAEAAAKASANFDNFAADLERKIKELKNLAFDEALQLADELEQFVEEQRKILNNKRAAAKIADIVVQAERAKKYAAECAQSGSNNFENAISNLKREIDKLNKLNADAAMEKAMEYEEFVEEQKKIVKKKRASTKFASILAITEETKTRLRDAAAAGLNTFDHIVDELRRSIKQLTDSNDDDAMMVAVELEEFIVEQSKVINRVRSMARLANIRAACEKLKASIIECAQACNNNFEHRVVDLRREMDKLCAFCDDAAMELSMEYEQFIDEQTAIIKKKRAAAKFAAVIAEIEQKKASAQEYAKSANNNFEHVITELRRKLEELLNMNDEDAMFIAMELEEFIGQQVAAFAKVRAANKFAAVLAATEALKGVISDAAKSANNNFDHKVSELNKKIQELYSTNDEDAMMVAMELEQFVADQTAIINKKRSAAKFATIVAETENLKAAVLNYAASGNNNFEPTLSNLQGKIAELESLSDDDAMGLAMELENFVHDATVQYRKKRTADKFAMIVAAVEQCKASIVGCVASLSNNFDGAVSELKKKVKELQATNDDDAMQMAVQLEEFIEEQTLNFKKKRAATKFAQIIAETSQLKNLVGDLAKSGNNNFAAKLKELRNKVTELKALNDDDATAVATDIESFIEEQQATVDRKKENGAAAAAPVAAKARPGLKKPAGPVIPPAKTPADKGLDQAISNIEKELRGMSLGHVANNIRNLEILNKAKAMASLIPTMHGDGCTPGRLEACLDKINADIKKAEQNLNQAMVQHEASSYWSRINFAIMDIINCQSKGDYEGAINTGLAKLHAAVQDFTTHELNFLEYEDIKKTFMVWINHFQTEVLHVAEEEYEKEKRSPYGDGGKKVAKFLEELKTGPYNIMHVLPKENKDDVEKYITQVKFSFSDLPGTIFQGDAGDAFKWPKIAPNASIPPAVLQFVSTFNKVGGFIANEVIKIVDDLRRYYTDPLNQLKEDEAPPAISHLLDTQINYAQDIARNIRQSGAEHDPTAQRMLEYALKFVHQYTEVTSKKLQQIADAVTFARFVRYSIGTLHSITVEFEKYIVKEYLPVSRLINQATRDGYTGPTFNRYTMHDKDERKEYKDYELTQYVLSKVEKLESMINQSLTEFDDVPNVAELRAKLEEVRQKTIKIHGVNCLRGAVQADAKYRQTYIEALRRYPIARKLAAHRVLLCRMHEYDRKLHLLPHDKKWTFNDPYANKTIEDAFPQESIEWYQKPYVRIEPRPIKQEEGAQAQVGQIVFSNEFIPENNAPVRYDNKFKVGESIYARANWPVLLNQYAIAKDRKTGELLKAPDQIENFSVELLLFVYIDGKLVERPGQPSLSFTYYRESANSGTSSFYSHLKTIQFIVQRAENENMAYGTGAFNNGEWDLISQRLILALRNANAAPGDHKIKFDLCFRIRADDLCPLDTTIFPDFDTPVSAPLATGELTLTIPSVQSLKLFNLLPVHRTDLAHGQAKSDEVARLAHEQMKQHTTVFGVPIKVATVSELYRNIQREARQREKEVEVRDHHYGGYQRIRVTETYHVNVCYTMCMNLLAAAYRNPQDSKEHKTESVAFMHLQATTRNENAPDVDTAKGSIPPLDGLREHNEFEIEADLMHDGCLDFVTRPPADERSGLKGIDLSQASIVNDIVNYADW
eukprot:GEZU01010990.1.p1 GENE.GEZU01010990.1~~GEZU01010990.1.p1  ORF type:complete len:1969 (+),score=875.10 GEZU01010990.1:179-6085(+)